MFENKLGNLMMRSRYITQISRARMAKKINQIAKERIPPLNIQIKDTHIVQWEYGKCTPKIDISILAEAYEIPLEEYEKALKEDRQKRNEIGAVLRSIRARRPKRL